MEKIIPNGTEVLIFKYLKGYGANQNENHFIKGVIQSSRESDDLSYHGSPWQVQIYEVLGEDGIKYYGTYGSRIIGNSFFRTVEDHVELIKRKISQNNEEIDKLKKDNDLNFKTITDLCGTIQDYDNKFYNSDFSSYDFMCLFAVLNASQQNYSFNKNNLIKFISNCKKFGLFDRLLNDIHIESNGTFELSDDLSQAIQKLEHEKIFYTSEANSSIMIFDDISMAEVIKKRINYFDEMVNFLCEYKKYELEMINQVYKHFYDQESIDIDSACVTLKKVKE